MPADLASSSPIVRLVNPVSSTAICSARKPKFLDSLVWTLDFTRACLFGAHYHALVFRLAHSIFIDNSGWFAQMKKGPSILLLLLCFLFGWVDRKMQYKHR